MNPAILLVDDESAILAILRRLIRELAPNYDLVTVSDGAAALALIAERPVVLVMTDQLMPDMDGVSLAVAIKAVAPQCPVILMTGYATSEIQHGSALQIGQAVQHAIPGPPRELFAVLVDEHRQN